MGLSLLNVIWVGPFSSSWAPGSLFPLPPLTEALATSTCFGKIIQVKIFYPAFLHTVVSFAEVESRTQGSRPRPRTQKKSEAKDSLSEDRHSRGQGQECSRPRPRTKDHKRKCFPKKKKKVFTKNFFRRSPKKKGLHKNFSSDLHKQTFSKKFFKRSTKF